MNYCQLEKNPYKKRRIPRRRNKAGDSENVEKTLIYCENGDIGYAGMAGGVPRLHNGWYVPV